MLKTDTQKMEKWFVVTAPILAKKWEKPMRINSRGYSKINVEEIEGFLKDFWLERDGQGEEFEEKGFGKLYQYTLTSLQFKKDPLLNNQAKSVIQNEEEECDYLEFIQDESYNPLSLLETLEEERDLTSMEDAISRVEFIKSNGISKTCNSSFNITTRQGRSIAAEIRTEKIKQIFKEVAKSKGLSTSQIKKLAKDIIEKEKDEAKTALLCEIFGITKTKGKKNGAEKPLVMDSKIVIPSEHQNPPELQPLPPSLASLPPQPQAARGLQQQLF